MKKNNNYYLKEVNGVTVKVFTHNNKPSLNTDLMIADICESKNGNLYGVFFDTTSMSKFLINLDDGKFVTYNDDLTNPKAPSGERDIVRVLRFVTLPQRDALSELMKYSINGEIESINYVLWEDKDPRVVKAENEYEEAIRMVEQARINLERLNGLK